MPRPQSKREYVAKAVLRNNLSDFEKRLSRKIDPGDAKPNSRIDGVADRLVARMDRFEKHLGRKIEVTAQSLKEYVDSRISQVRGDVQGVKDDVQQVQTGLQQLSEKLDRKVEGIVQLIEGSTGRQVQVEERLDNHEARITAIEGRTK